MESVGNRITLLRNKLNISQYDMADALGIAQKTISHWEIDKTEPSADVIKKIYLTFGVSANWLILGKGEMFLLTEEEEDNSPAKVNTLLNIQIAKCTPSVIFIEAYNYSPEKDPSGRLKETIKKDMEKFLKNVLENFKQLSNSMEKKYKAYSS